jgi:SAM-dependent methyltransferase
MLAQADIQRLPVADNSIDLIFTDPPYLTEFVPCYEWLANEAMRVLRPGGFVLAMCGGLHLPKIYRFFEDSGLTYFFEMQQKSNGDAPTVWKHVDGKGYPVIARAKPIIVYSKGLAVPEIGGVHNLFETGPGWSEAKRFHRWGQDVNTCRYYIEYFSGPGEIVLDPFVGGGTTMIAAELVGRRAIGFDVDWQAVRTTKARREATEIPTALPLFSQVLL